MHEDIDDFEPDMDAYYRNVARRDRNTLLYIGDGSLYKTAITVKH